MPNGSSPENLSEFMKFLACRKSDGDRVPPLTELSATLDVSVASLREQMEVARALGLVEVKPKTGIRRLPFTFRPAVTQSLAYSIAIDPKNFQYYTDFRRHIEMAYWNEAVVRLEPQDKLRLKELVKNAQLKLAQQPVQIPHFEHRELHLLIFRRIENPFVMGALEAYWEVYEAVGLNVYTDLNYLENVWDYHQKMVDAICAGNYADGFRFATEHMDLIYQRAKNPPAQVFE
jgi:DNA-binding FadR family transcriptional regulator